MSALYVQEIAGPPRYVAGCHACGWTSASITTEAVARSLLGVHVCGEAAP